MKCIQGVIQSYSGKLDGSLVFLVTFLLCLRVFFTLGQIRGVVNMEVFLDVVSFGNLFLLDMEGELDDIGMFLFLLRFSGVSESVFRVCSFRQFFVFVVVLIFVRFYGNCVEAQGFVLFLRFVGIRRVQRRLKVFCGQNLCFYFYFGFSKLRFRLVGVLRVVGGRCF